MAAIERFYFPSRAISVITDPMTTHACGILAPIPWNLLTAELPPGFLATEQRRALGTFFMPRGRVREITGIVEETLQSTGWTSLHWRNVPVCFDRFDHQRRQAMPAILQVRRSRSGQGRPLARQGQALSRDPRGASARASSRSCRSPRRP
jgi:glutamate synthase domain-containing protein 1